MVMPQYQKSLPFSGYFIIVFHAVNMTYSKSVKMYISKLRNEELKTFLSNKVLSNIKKTPNHARMLTPKNMNIIYIPLPNLEIFI